jgi:hypothetical protein
VGAPEAHAPEAPKGGHSAGIREILAERQARREAAGIHGLPTEAETKAVLGRLTVPELRRAHDEMNVQYRRVALKSELVRNLYDEVTGHARRMDGPSGVPDSRKQLVDVALEIRPPTKGPEAHTPEAPAVPSPEVRKVEVQNRILEEYGKLRHPGEWVGMADLREATPDVTREEFDAAMHQFGRGQFGPNGTRVIPVANTKALTPRDRAAAVRGPAGENLDAFLASDLTPIPSPKAHTPEAPAKVATIDRASLTDGELRALQMKRADGRHFIRSRDSAKGRVYDLYEYRNGKAAVARRGRTEAESKSWLGSAAEEEQRVLDLYHAKTPTHPAESTLVKLGSATSRADAEALLKPHTKPELQDIARQAGVPFTTRATKATLTSAILDEVGHPSPEDAQAARNFAALTRGGRDVGEVSPWTGLADGPPVPHANKFKEGPAAGVAERTGRLGGDEPLYAPNGGADQGLVHFDSALGTLWIDLVSDSREPNSVVNEIAHIGEDVGRGTLSLDDAAARLRELQAVAPDQGVAKRIEETIRRITAPPSPPIDVPDNTPPSVRSWLEQLAAIPTMRKTDNGMDRRDKSVLDEALDLVRQISEGQRTGTRTMSAGEAQRRLTLLPNNIHESIDGVYQARRITGPVFSHERVVGYHTVNGRTEAITEPNPDWPAVQAWLRGQPPTVPSLTKKVGPSGGDGLDELHTGALADLAREHGMDVPYPPQESDRESILTKLRSAGVSAPVDEPIAGPTAEERAAQDAKLTGWLRKFAEGGGFVETSTYTGAAGERNRAIADLRSRGFIRREGGTNVITPAGRAHLASLEAPSAPPTVAAGVDRSIKSAISRLPAGGHRDSAVRIVNGEATDGGRRLNTPALQARHIRIMADAHVRQMEIPYKGHPTPATLADLRAAQKLSGLLHKLADLVKEKGTRYAPTPKTRPAFR